MQNKSLVEQLITQSENFPEDFEELFEVNIQGNSIEIIKTQTCSDVSTYETENTRVLISMGVAGCEFIPKNIHLFGIEKIETPESSFAHLPFKVLETVSAMDKMYTFFKSLSYPDPRCLFPICRVPKKLGFTCNQVLRRNTRPDWYRGKRLHYRRSTTRLPKKC